MVITNDLIRSQERVREHGEVFTPPHIVDEMIALIPDEVWVDSNKNTLEPTCGNGNFIVAILRKKMTCGQTILQALRGTYGIDIMPDNIITVYHKVYNEFLKNLSDDMKLKCLTVMLYQIRVVEKKGGGTLGLNLSKVSKVFPNKFQKQVADALIWRAEKCLSLLKNEQDITRECLMAYLKPKCPEKPMVIQQVLEGFDVD